MADIIIAIMVFPNDPTNNKVAHQMFLASQTSNYLELYSVSSILGKEKRVYGAEKENYVTILPPEDTQNGFKVPSFIDCAKMYQVEISDSLNLAVLSQRSIAADLRQRIEEKIAELKLKGKHITYPVLESEFRAWNPRI